MTWQWVVIILGVLAFLGYESYISAVKERTSIARETLQQRFMDDYAAQYGEDAADQAFAPRNGDS